MDCFEFRGWTLSYWFSVVNKILDLRLPYWRLHLPYFLNYVSPLGVTVSFSEGFLKNIICEKAVKKTNKQNN